MNGSNNSLTIAATTNLDSGIVMKMEQERIGVERQVDAAIRLIELRLEGEVENVQGQLKEDTKLASELTDQRDTALVDLTADYWKGRLTDLRKAVVALGGELTEGTKGHTTLGADNTIRYQCEVKFDFGEQGYSSRCNLTIRSDGVKLPKTVIALRDEVSEVQARVRASQSRLDDLRTEIGALDYNRQKMMRNFNAQQALNDPAMNATATEFANASLSKFGLSVEAPNTTPATRRKRV